LLEVDDPTNVQLDWQLTGVATPVVGGTWLVELFIDDVDGVGATSGSLGASGPIGITGGVSPLTFTHTFNIPANRVGVGLYQLSATINHSPVGNPNQLSEMIGFAQSLPIKFTTTVVETNYARGPIVQAAAIPRRRATPRRLPAHEQRREKAMRRASSGEPHRDEFHTDFRHWPGRAQSSRPRNTSIGLGGYASAVLG